MKLTLTLEETPFVLSLENEDGLVANIDAAEAIGGKKKGLRPMELFAGSLAGCMSIDVLLILQKQRITVDTFAVEVNATRSEGVPAKFERIELQFTVDEGVPLEKIANAVSLSREKYCSVAASMDPDITIVTTIKQQL